MGMLPPVSQRAYTTQNQKWFVASGDVREASFADDDAELRKDVPEDQVLDITVTCDGTLARRGFQSLYGVVVVVSWKSGKVLDVEVLSKHCWMWKYWASTARLVPHTMKWILPLWNFGLEGRSPGFMWGKLLWFILRDGVKWSPCNLETVCKQEYAQVYTDDIRWWLQDIQASQWSAAHGASNLVSKHECVGHVQKRMGTALKEKAKEKLWMRGESMWGWGGRDRSQTRR